MDQFDLHIGRHILMINVYLPEPDWNPQFGRIWKLHKGLKRGFRFIGKNKIENYMKSLVQDGYARKDCIGSDGKPYYEFVKQRLS